MNPQDFKALLDALHDINSNLEKIAKLENVLMPLKRFLEKEDITISGERVDIPPIIPTYTGDTEKGGNPK